jgi:hypothetical protein
MKVALLVLFISQYAIGQVFAPTTAGTAGGPATSEFDYLTSITSERDMSDGYSIDTLRIEIPDSNQLCLVFVGGVFDWVDTSLDSVECLDNGINFTYVSAYDDAAGQAIGMYYMLDTDLPGTDSMDVAVYAAATPDILWAVMWYSGVDQTTPFTNPDSAQNCGWNSISTSTGGAAMSWSWTNNVCHTHVVGTINGAVAGTEALDCLLVYDDGVSYSIGSGQTENWSITETAADCDVMSSRE